MQLALVVIEGCIMRRYHGRDGSSRPELTHAAALDTSRSPDVPSAAVVEEFRRGWGFEENRVIPATPRRHYFA